MCSTSKPFLRFMQWVQYRNVHVGPSSKEFQNCGSVDVVVTITTKSNIKRKLRTKEEDLPTTPHHTQSVPKPRFPDDWETVQQLEELLRIGWRPLTSSVVGSFLAPARTTWEACEWKGCFVCRHTLSRKLSTVCSCRGLATLETGRLTYLLTHSLCPSFVGTFLFERPLFLFPNSFQCHDCFGVLVGGMLRTCPKDQNRSFKTLNVCDDVDRNIFITLKEGR